ncbi:hypothetical protein MIZ03_1576 [Rhodoferax lithotrophicus]|uniref:Uncharacterized protein n=1 Tax=Rhodoferax lithotrophicus TaxID=2798804 RepID=A0ABM7MKJ0_9BURK|nr:hypothetical protein MIZ03_1576 [Rhodoferax sp. MIZ03]
MTARIASIQRRLSAKHTSLNSACAFFNPRVLDWRNPSTFLIQLFPQGAKCAQCGSS